MPHTEDGQSAVIAEDKIKRFQQFKTQYIVFISSKLFHITLYATKI